MVSDMSGCSGNQAVAVSIREMALGNVPIRRGGDRAGLNPAVLRTMRRRSVRALTEEVSRL
jgi:hypothetical protein